MCIRDRVVGTAKYMSPEQARGVEVDGRSDIFSLGSVMYEMVTGRAAFDGVTASDVMAEILKVEPPPPIEFAPDMPPEIERIIGKALRKDRDTCLLYTSPWKCRLIDREVMRPLVHEFPLPSISACICCPASVSYTHLDVYKRQGPVPPINDWWKLSLIVY